MRKIKKDDMVRIIAGKDKGKDGKVLRMIVFLRCAFSHKDISRHHVP